MTPPKLITSPLARSVEKLMVSPVWTPTVKVIVSEPLIWPVVPVEIVTVVPLSAVTVVPAAISVPETAKPDVTPVGALVRVKVLLPLFIVPLVLPVTVVLVAAAFEIVTVVAVFDTTVVSVGIAAGDVVSVTVMPICTAAGTDAKFKVVLPPSVAALVVSVAATVPVTGFEIVTVVAVVDTTVVPVGIAEGLV